MKNEEANQYLLEWCKATDWRRTRAVVFLDPYGMQVEWALLQEIARTRAIDLWFLFPLGVAVMRLLTRKEPPPETWANRLTRICGTDDWRQQLYQRRQAQTLFGAEESEQREADYKAVATFFLDRLKVIFARVAEHP